MECEACLYECREAERVKGESERVVTSEARLKECVESETQFVWTRNGDGQADGVQERPNE